MRTRRCRGRERGQHRTGAALLLEIGGGSGGVIFERYLVFDFFFFAVVCFCVLDDGA